MDCLIDRSLCFLMYGNRVRKDWVESCKSGFVDCILNFGLLLQGLKVFERKERQFVLLHLLGEWNKYRFQSCERYRLERICCRL